MNIEDPDGKFYVKERIELAKTKGSGRQDYKFTNPSTKKIENKTAYIEKIDNLIFGCGVYKP
jgi:signal transduction histidine kinase